VWHAKWNGLPDLSCQMIPNHLSCSAQSLHDVQDDACDVQCVVTNSKGFFLEVMLTLNDSDDR
jgi:hypothetical protein